MAPAVEVLEVCHEDRPVGERRGRREAERGLEASAALPRSPPPPAPRRRPVERRPPGGDDGLLLVERRERDAQILERLGRDPLAPAGAARLPPQRLDESAGAQNAFDEFAVESVGSAVNTGNSGVTTAFSI